MSQRRARGRAGVAGSILLAVGIGGLTWGNLIKFSPATIGCMALMVGVVLMCSDWLDKRSTSNNESYKIGYDLGYEAGYAAAEPAARPVVVPMRRTCNCSRGDSEASSAVATAADRG